jgi:hypothetical protein
MRVLTWIVALLALCASLDTTLYDGAYTRAFVSAVNDAHIAIGLK